MAKVCIAVSSHNRPLGILRLLRSINMQEKFYDYEILIVDDTVGDAVANVIADEPNRMKVRYVHIDPCNGNEGWRQTLDLAKASGAEYIKWFYDDDYFVDPEALFDGVKYLDEHPEASQVFYRHAAKVKNKVGVDWYGCMGFQKPVFLGKDKFMEMCLSNPHMGGLTGCMSMTLVRNDDRLRIMQPADFVEPRLVEKAPRTWSCDIVYTMEAGMTRDGVIVLPWMAVFGGNDDTSVSFSEEGNGAGLHDVLIEEIKSKAPWTKHLLYPDA